ncbi:hypothetical protein OROHE_026231 [Orobanche hederae]
MRAVCNIDIHDLSSSYRSRGPRARNEQSDHTLEHHYRVDIFYEAINCQLMELDHRFNDSAMELLHLWIPKMHMRLFEVLMYFN